MTEASETSNLKLGPPAGQVALKYAALSPFIILAAILYLFPIVYLVNVTFKTSTEFMVNPVGVAQAINLANYAAVVNQGGFIRSFINTIWYTAAANAVTLLVTAMAAFVISRKYVKFSGLLYVLFLAGIFLPDPLIPQFRLILSLGLYNNPIGYLLLKINPGIVMLLMVGYYKTVSKEFDEAAGIEGCTTLRYVFQFLIPYSKPVLATSAILFSVGIWNDIIGSTIFLTSPKYYPVIRTLFRFVGQYGSDWPPLASAVLVIALPLIVIFIFFQKYIIAGAVAGGLKG
jgi:raffinose/stachyose/melibiose transport system permease protein